MADRATGSTNARRPNVLLITSDQQHRNTIGAFNPQIRTPSLDRLVREGTAFTRAYTPNPTCTPTRSSIITGRYPSQHGGWTLGAKLPETEPTLGAQLSAAGYRTALVGKAHFQPLRWTGEYTSLESEPILHDADFWRRFHGPFYGFDHVELARNHTSENHVGQHYALWMADRDPDWARHFEPPVGTLPPDARHRWSIPEELHYDTWIAERTNALLGEFAAQGAPFFCWASFFDPHPPYLVPEPWDTLYDPDSLDIPEITPGEHAANPPQFALTQQEHPDFSPWAESGFGIHGFHSHLEPPAERRRLVATYYAMVSLLDKYVGKILDRLAELGLADDTIVVYSTDHGHLFGQHGLQAKGAFLYEDLIRVPLVVRYPGRVPAGRVSDAIQSLVDLSPTFLDFLGLPIPRRMTGISERRCWTGQVDRVRDHAVCEFHHEPTTVNLRTYVDQRYKITVYQGREYGELYDLQDDPGERRNLWSDPSAAELKTRLLLRYVSAELAKEPLWMPRIAVA